MSTNPNLRSNRASTAAPFVMSPAEFTGTNLMIGLVSPSGGGKTKSALELARGIQVVTGGKIGIADTENLRALHYAKEYQFLLPDGTKGLHHLPIDPPFGPLRYKAAYEHMISRGVTIIITDSFSHEHDGIGGVLEIHDDELTRMKDPSAWGKPKGERNELVGYILQVKGVHWIFCFRAKEKMRWKAGHPPEARGLMPQGNEAFIFEQTCNFLLPAGANGVPVLASPYPDEELILKTPGQFRHLFTEPRQLSAALGTHLAAWACPSWKGALPPLPAPMKKGQSTSVSYTSQSKTIPTAADAVADAAAVKTLAVESVAAPPFGISPIDALIQMYESATVIDSVDALADRTKQLLAISSPEDCARMKDAANAALDRLDPPIVTDPPPKTTGVVTQPQTAQATNGLGQAVTPRQPEVMSTSTTTPPTAPRELSAIEQLNADGLASFRDALASLGPVITQEQAAQLVRDHLSEYAQQPKVGTEDGAMAQDEIMKRTQPPFASRASLGVMRRHLEQCDAHPAYKVFCSDLLLCTTAENVYELWRMSGEVIDALPKQPQTDARSRTVKRVEEVDPSIKDGGPWLTKRIREAKTNVAASTKGSEITPTVTPPGVVATPTAVASSVPPNPTTDHAPITSDVGRVLALDLEKAATIEVVEEMKTRIDRAFLQKRIPTVDAKTLTALQTIKKASIEAGLGPA